MRWDKLTTFELERCLAKPGMVCLLPVGATEQHGPHLATGTDTLCADAICHSAAERADCLVLPALAYGCSLGHSHKWPGTISLHPVTMIQALVDIGRWAFDSGVRNLLFVSGHATNGPCLASAILQLRYEYPEFRLQQIGLWEVSSRAKDLYMRDAEDPHANWTETSIMLYLDPFSVRSNLTTDVEDRSIGRFWNYAMPAVTENGVVGSPTKASLKDGKAAVEIIVEDLTALVAKAGREVWPQF